MNNFDSEEYYKIIYPILAHPEFQKRKLYKHHGNISVYEHSINVSKKAYMMAKKNNKDYKSAAIGGLLHDFYYKPWQEDKVKKEFFKQHGFVHAKEALDNSKKYFSELMNEKIEDIILRHMFPLNKVPPKYIESWYVTLADKYVSMEIFKDPKNIILLLGFKKGVKK